jgi:RecB family exonuclease
MAVLATGGHWDTWTFAGISPPGPDSPIISGAITLSPSQAESYSTCPRRYALERRLRLGDPTNQYARFGSLVHAALERAERGVIGTGRDHATVAEGLEAISEVWVDADFGTPELDSAWKRKAEELVTKLYEKWPAKTGATMAVEMNVTADIGGVPWRGVVDRVDDLGPGVRIVDYKTSTSYPTHPEAKTSIQLGFYAAALSGLGHRVDEAQLWYPRAPTVGITVRKLDLDRLDEVVSTMEDITTSILGEEWAATPGGHCKRCQFKSSCPVWPEGEGAFLP